MMKFLKSERCITCDSLGYNSELGWICPAGGEIRCVHPTDRACRYYRKWLEQTQGKRTGETVPCISIT